MKEQMANLSGISSEVCSVQSGNSLYADTGMEMAWAEKKFEAVYPSHVPTVSTDRTRHHAARARILSAARSLA